jgi:predicted ABC-type transport system involved in lysophospholipase L1 biosynthesis ATPase subunit
MTSPSPAPILEAAALRKTYAGASRPVEVLRGVDLSVPRGRTTAVTGLSGAGKSTLLYALAGLDPPDSGTVRFRGTDIYALRPDARAALRARSIGFVFQAYHLLPELTLLENVSLPALALPGAWRRGPAIRRKARALLAAVGLAGREAHRPAELSGGEQQRAAIARALVNDPELLLADEPTGNLDSLTGEDVLSYLFSLVASRSVTLVMVTHNDAIAARCHLHFPMRDGILLPPA